MTSIIGCLAGKVNNDTTVFAAWAITCIPRNVFSGKQAETGHAVMFIIRISDGAKTDVGSGVDTGTDGAGETETSIGSVTIGAVVVTGVLVATTSLSSTGIIIDAGSAGIGSGTGVVKPNKIRTGVNKLVKKSNIVSCY